MTLRSICSDKWDRKVWQMWVGDESHWKWGSNKMRGKDIKWTLIDNQNNYRLKQVWVTLQILK